MTTTTENAIPDHVPAHLVYDFHTFDDERYKIDPYTRIREMLKEAPPVFWSRSGNSWYVTRYDALIEAFKQTDIFSNALYGVMPDDFVYMPVPLMVDPPRHQIYSAPLKSEFSPQAMVKLEGVIRKLAAELIDKVVKQGRCDFIEAISEPLPILIFLEILGLPAERFTEFRKLALNYIGAVGATEQYASVVEVDKVLGEFIEERRERPRNDLISRLWKLEIEGRPITVYEMRRYALMLFAAGLDSVTNGMGHAMHYLARNPMLQRRLRDHPEEIHAATEELLRCHGVTTPPRRVAQDVEFYGAPMKAGDHVEMLVIAGNLDDQAFPDAANFHARRDRTHLTFGFGIHRCIGAHLARIEFHALFHEWLARMPEVRLDPDKRCTFDPGHVLRISQLPLIWKPTA